MSAMTIFDRLDDPADHLCGLDDPHRMLVLASIDVHNPDLRRRLDDVTARTATRLNLPVALVTLVLDTAQVFAGSYGIDDSALGAGTPVEWSLCAHAVATGQPYVVTEAATDPIQATNPLVTMAGIGSYAGVPLMVDGYALGTHCVIADTAHTFTDVELDELRSAADDIVTLLQRHRIPLR